MLQWFGHVERDRIAKRVYLGVCASSHSVSRLPKRWIDSVKVFKGEVWMSGKQGECWGFVGRHAAV